MGKPELIVMKTKINSAQTVLDTLLSDTVGSKSNLHISNAISCLERANGKVSVEISAYTNADIKNAIGILTDFGDSLGILSNTDMFSNFMNYLDTQSD